MNVTQWIKDIISNPERKSMPIMTHPGIELIGKKVIDAVTDGDIHFQAIKALNESFPNAVACTTIMDLTVEAEAFGAELRMSENEVPTVSTRLLSNFDDVNRLEVPSLAKARVPQYLKADALAAANIDKPVFAGCIGPYSLAGRLYDMTEIMMAIYTEPETVTLLIEKCTQFLLGYCKAIKETGVAGVVLAEPAAGLLSNEDCYNYSSIFIKRIIDAVQDDNFAVVLHNCGNTGHCTPAMISTGAKGLHFGNRADMVEALNACPVNLLVVGNVDPVEVFKMSSPEDVFRVADNLLEKTRKFPNFVISSGCDTPPDIPFENIEAFYQAVDEFNHR